MEIYDTASKVKIIENEKKEVYSQQQKRLIQWRKQKFYKNDKLKKWIDLSITN